MCFNIEEVNYIYRNKKGEIKMDLLTELEYAYDKVIGIDLGNGLINVRSVYDDGTPYKLTMPNAFVRKEDLGLGDAVKNLKLDFYGIEGIVYGWGKEIMNLSPVHSSAGYMNRYRAEPYKIMTKIVLAKVYDDLNISADDDVLIVTGVPSDETGTESEKEIQEAFMGVHDVTVNGKNLLFKVVNVEVMAQPVATVMSRYLNEYGLVGDKRYEEMKVAVIDIGGGTTDLDIVHNMRRLNNYQSVKHGFNRIYDKIRAEIAKKYPTSRPTNFTLLRLLIQGENEEGKFLYKPSMRLEPVDFTDALDKGIYDLVVDIHGTITAYWVDQTDIDELLLVGGSAELFEEYIGDVADGVVVPENNGDSNVEGYFRTGMMRSLQKAKARKAKAKQSV